MGSQPLFVAIMCVILSMYGGGFATVPAYLADVFGTQFVGAIHGRLLTAWSTAGVLGPLLMARFRQSQLDAGVPHDQLYDRTLYILAGLLAVGFIANLLVRPLQDRWFMTESRVAELQAGTRIGNDAPLASGIDTGGVSAKVALAWAVVGLPILWGVWLSLSNALVLFR